MYNDIILLVTPSGQFRRICCDSPEKVLETVIKYTGNARNMEVGLLGDDTVLYYSKQNGCYLPYNNTLTWLLASGVADNVTETIRGYGVVCRFDSLSGCIGGFNSTRLHELLVCIGDIL